MSLYLRTAFCLMFILFSSRCWAQTSSASKAKIGKQAPPLKPNNKPGLSTPKPPPPLKKPKHSAIEVKTTVRIPGPMVILPEPEEAPPLPAPPQFVRRNLVDMSFQLLGIASWNKVSGNGAAVLVSDLGGGLRTSVGPNIDLYFFRDRYAFSTGLWYTIRRMGYSFPPDRLTTATVANRTAAFNLQCLQVPVTMKLVSNTLFPTGRSFIQYGGTIDVKIAETPLDRTNNYLYQRDGSIDQFSSAGLSLLLAVGYMHRVGPTNELIMTMQYQRSLTNNAIASNLRTINQHLGFGLGLSF